MANWLTLCEETDALTKQKGGEAWMVQTTMTDECRILRQPLVHRPQHLSAPGLPFDFRWTRF